MAVDKYAEKNRILAENLHAYMLASEILAEPVRKPGQGPAIIVGPSGEPLEKDLRGPAMHRLAGLPSQKFDGTETADGFGFND